MNPGGLFIFDFWYAPAVLGERPSIRIKRQEDERIRLTRIAEPVMHIRENTVDVNYHLFVRDIASGAVDEMRECHRMRYFSEPEIDFFLSGQALEILEASEFMTRKTLGWRTWNACIVARKTQR